MKPILSAGLFIFGTIGLVLLLSAGTSPAGDRQIPFKVGERITYQLKWGFIPAGKVVLEVLPHTTINGQPARHFRMTTRTNGTIDIIYKVRGVVDGYIDLGLNHSLHYQKKQREGSSRREAAVLFDWEKSTGQYHNLKKTGPRTPIAIAEGCFDPFSVIYFCRLFDFTDKDVLERPVTDGKKQVMGRVANRGRQTLVIGGKSYETFLLEPDIKDLSGVFKKSKDANIFIWMSADQRHIPVKVKSKVVVGSFTAELISYEAE